MRLAGAAAAVAAGALVLAPAASARKFHQFYVAGTSGQVTASLDQESVSSETGGQNDKLHAEVTDTWTFVKPRGVVGYGQIEVPFSGPASPSSLLSGGGTERHVVKLTASGQTWIRTGSGEDTSGHYAGWSCTARETGTRNAGFTPIRIGRSYGVETLGATGWEFALASGCTQSEPGAVPGGGVGIGGDRRSLLAMLLTHTFTRHELAARRETLRMTQAHPDSVDCHDGDFVRCTLTVRASAKLKLQSACRRPATMIGRGFACNDALPQPR